MKKILIKIIAAVTAVLLIAGVLFVYNALCGNIFSAMYAKSQIEKYIDETYPDNDYEVGDAKYGFKFGEYYCTITHPDSEDGGFTATYEGGGTVTDDYDLAVTGLNNTLMRLEDGFRKDIEPLLDRYFDEDGKEFGFGTVIGDKEADRSKLYLDMEFDTKNMPIDTYVYGNFESDSDESLARMQKIAKELSILGYRIDYYSFSNDADYFDNVPTQELLDAESPTDLAQYKLADDVPKDKYDSLA